NVLHHSVLDRPLHELRLEQKGIAGSNSLAGLKTGHDFGEAIVATTDNDGTLFESIRRPGEDHLVAADRLYGTSRHDLRNRLLFDCDCRVHKRAGSPGAAAVINFRNNAC